MQSGEISDGQLSASSERDSKHSATQSRLHFVNPDGAGSWAAESNGTDQWLQVDLVNLHTRVTRVATQGSNGHQGEWVTKYSLQYGNDTERFYNFTVPEQNTTKVKLIFLYIDSRLNRKRSISGSSLAGVLQTHRP